MGTNKKILAEIKVFFGNRFYRQYGTQLTMLCVLIALCLALSIASPFFLQKSNILNIGVSFQCQEPWRQA